MTEARVLIAGSPHWRDRELLTTVLFNVRMELWQPNRRVVLVTGGSDVGAVRLAEEVWLDEAWPLERHAPDWTNGAEAEPIRNRAMVRAGADVVLGFRSLVGINRDADDLIGLARCAGLPIRLIEN